MNVERESPAFRHGEIQNNIDSIMQEASLDHPAVIGERGLVLNDTCTQEQRQEEERHACNYVDREQMLAALKQINEHDKAFLEEYENSKGHSKGDTDRAYYLRSKARKLYEESRN